MTFTSLMLHSPCGGMSFAASGDSTPFVAEPGSLDMAIALVAPGGDTVCASGTTTLRPDLRKTRLRAESTLGHRRTLR